MKRSCGKAGGSSFPFQGKNREVARRRGGRPVGFVADLFDPQLSGGDLVFVGEHAGIVIYAVGVV